MPLGPSFPGDRKYLSLEGRKAREPQVTLSGQAFAPREQMEKWPPALFLSTGMLEIPGSMCKAFATVLGRQKRASCFGLWKLRGTNISGAVDAKASTLWFGKKVRPRAGAANRLRCDSSI